VQSAFIRVQSAFIKVQSAFIKIEPPNRCHPEEGASPPRDRRQSCIGTEAKKSVSGVCALLIPAHSTKASYCRTVPHAGFAAVQDDRVSFGCIRNTRCTRFPKNFERFPPSQH